MPNNPRNGSRPIHRQDSAATLPQRLTYPNGTYVSQGSNGASGSFGAMLPTVPKIPVRTLGTQAQGGTLPNGQPIPFGSGASNNPYKVGGAVSSGFQTPTTNGFQTNRSSFNPIAVNGFQTPTTNGLQTTQSSYQPAPQPTNFDTVVPVNDMRTYIAAGGEITRPPSNSVFTGDPNDPNTALWVNYWNAKAIKPDKPAPRVMTKDQIWNMKAQQRRRNAGTGNGDTGSTLTTTYQPFFTRSVSLRL